MMVLQLSPILSARSEPSVEVQHHPPWEILQRYNIEEDFIHDLLMPLLARGVSLKLKDAADNMEASRIFAASRIVGMPSSGEECLHCIKDGGLCMVPVRAQPFGDTHGVHAIGRCTNCVLAGLVCDLPLRTFYTECLCDWFMPDKDRFKYDLWLNDRCRLLTDLGRPIRGRQLGRVAWKRFGAYASAEAKLAKDASLTLPSTDVDKYSDLASWIETKDRFLQAVSPGAWVRPSDYKPGPCSCIDMPLRGTPRSWDRLELALRSRGPPRYAGWISSSKLDALKKSNTSSPSLQVHRATPKSNAGGSFGEPASAPGNQSRKDQLKAPGSPVPRPARPSTSGLTQIVAAQDVKPMSGRPVCNELGRDGDSTEAQETALLWKEGNPKQSNSQNCHTQ